MLPALDHQATPETISLTESERQKCEVWTRVMGYHRPVSSFNIGKQGEHEQRSFFATGKSVGAD